MPSARFMVEYTDAATRERREVAVTARGVAEARAKAESLGLVAVGARLVEILDDLPAQASAPVGSVPSPAAAGASPLAETRCPRCNAGAWFTGRGPLAWFIAALLFPIGLLAPLVAIPRHRCRGCGFVYRSPIPPVGDVESDGSAAAGIVWAAGALLVALFVIGASLRVIG